MCESSSDSLIPSIYPCSLPPSLPLPHTLITEVSNFDVSISIQEDVLGLEVAIHNRFLMKIVQSNDDFR